MKQSSGARRMPAPIWPPSLPARPPSITGTVPVPVTLKMSMPTGVPRKPKYGIRKSGCSAVGDVVHRRVQLDHLLGRAALVGLQPERGRLGEPAEARRSR